MNWQNCVEKRKVEAHNAHYETGDHQNGKLFYDLVFIQSAHFLKIHLISIYLVFKTTAPLLHYLIEGRIERAAITLVIFLKNLIEVVVSAHFSFNLFFEAAHLLLEVVLVEVKYFVDAPHPCEVNSHNAEEGKHSDHNLKVALERPGRCFFLVLREKNSVKDAVKHHQQKAQNYQFGGSRLVRSFVSVVDKVACRQNENRSIEKVEYPRRS